MKRRVNVLVVNEYFATHLAEMAFKEACMYPNRINATSPDIVKFKNKLDREKYGALAIFDHVIINCKNDDLGVLFAFQAAEQFPKQSTILITKNTTEAMSKDNLHIFANLAQAMDFIRETR